jgi:hypothetical protein
MAASSASWMRQLGSNVRSVKFLLCPVTPSSKPALDFFIGSYNTVKHLNPTLPYSLRAAPEKPPLLVVEFDFGEKAHIPLDGLDIAGVERKVRARPGAALPPPSPHTHSRPASLVRASLTRYSCSSPPPPTASPPCPADGAGRGDWQGDASQRGAVGARSHGAAHPALCRGLGGVARLCRF